MLLRSFVPRLGIPPTHPHPHPQPHPHPDRPVASCSLSTLLGVTSCRGQAARDSLLRRRSAGARGGTSAFSDGGVAARNPSVTWSPQGASAKVGTRPWSESQPVGAPVTAGRGGWERGYARFCGHSTPGLPAALSNCSQGSPREGAFLRVV